MFGLLSFAGFEGAASLGEETDEPRKKIPARVLGAAVGIGIFYIFVILAQTLRVRHRRGGRRRPSPAPARRSATSPRATSALGLADAINLGATLSAFASALGTATAGSRILFALSRDGLPAQPARPHVAPHGRAGRARSPCSWWSG